MTKIDIEQIKADREEGMEGPWVVHNRKTPWAIPSGKTGFHNEYLILTGYDHPQLKGPTPIVALSRGVGTPESGPVELLWLREDDARRIARVPDMEDALIDAVEALSQLSREAELADALGYGWKDARTKALKALERFK